MPERKYIKRTATNFVAFFKSCIEVQENGCWHWVDTMHNAGYGCVSIAIPGYNTIPDPETGRKKSHSFFAHRVAYTLFKGPIPEGLIVDHTCHNPDTCHGGKTCMHRRCVNPDHLYATTKKDNCHTTRSCKGRQLAAKFAAQVFCKRGHAFTPSNTYIPPSSNSRHCITCRRMRGRAFAANKRRKMLTNESREVKITQEER